MGKDRRAEKSETERALYSLLNFIENDEFNKESPNYVYLKSIENNEKSYSEQRIDFLEKRNSMLERKVLDNSFLIFRITTKDENYPSKKRSFTSKYYYDSDSHKSKKLCLEDIFNSVRYIKRREYFSFSSKIETFGMNWAERLKVRLLFYSSFLNKSMKKPKKNKPIDVFAKFSMGNTIENKIKFFRAFEGGVIKFPLSSHPIQFLYKVNGYELVTSFNCDNFDNNTGKLVFSTILLSKDSLSKTNVSFTGLNVSQLIDYGWIELVD